MSVRSAPVGVRADVFGGAGGERQAEDGARVGRRVVAPGKASPVVVADGALELRFGREASAPAGAVGLRVEPADAVDRLRGAMEARVVARVGEAGDGGAGGLQAWAATQAS